MENNQRRGFFRKFLSIVGLGTILTPLSVSGSPKKSKSLIPGITQDPFIGQILAVGFNFAPEGWLQCNGQLLAINNNQALFSLLGTTFGGDGETTFGIPDLRGRTIVGVGTGPGLSPRSWGEKSGSEKNTITIQNLPPHNHTTTISGDIKMPVAASIADTDDPADAYPAAHQNDFYGSTPSSGEFHGDLQNNLSVAVNQTGNGTQINNMQPWIGIHYIIATQGIFPSEG